MAPDNIQVIVSIHVLEYIRYYVGDIAVTRARSILPLRNFTKQLLN